MNNLDKIKNKVEALKKREFELDQRELAINALLPIGLSLSTKIKSKVASNKMALFLNIIEGLSSKIEGLDNSKEIVEAIEEQTKGLKGETSKKIAREMKNLIKKVEKFEEKTFFDQDAFNKVFAESITKIANFIKIPDEVPELVSYTRRAKDNKITKVIERFSNYRLVHTWSYDGKSNLVKVSTETVDEST